MPTVVSPVVARNGPNEVAMRVVKIIFLYYLVPVPVAARSKAWVCGGSPVEIVGSNPTRVMDVCCECCVVR